MGTAGVLAIGTEDGRVRILDTDTGAEHLNVKGHLESVHCVALSPSGDRLASASFDRSWKIWDVYDRRELLHVRGHDREAPCCCEIGLFGRCCRSVRASCPVTGNSRAVESIAFSADGERVATGGADTAVMVWDARARRRQLLLSGHSGFVVAVSFSADGGRLLPAGLEGALSEWCARTGARLRVLRADGADVVAGVACSRDGLFLVPPRPQRLQAPHRLSRLSGSGARRPRAACTPRCSASSWRCK